MKIKTLFLFALVLICAVLTLASCNRGVAVGPAAGPKIGHGPPPHAPAHGYRRKYQGVQLVYNSGLGVYVVVGFPNHYYHKGRYYRVVGTRWETGVSIGGQWKLSPGKSVPTGLRAKVKGKAQPPGQGQSKAQPQIQGQSQGKVQDQDKGKPKVPPGRGRGVQKKKK